MDTQATVSLSKFLSFVLRHQPESIGLTLDANGWVDVAQLLAQCQAHGRPISLHTLRHVVTTNPKQRFAFSLDELRIRANQGHSVDVDLGYAPAAPPVLLFHGTVAACLDAVRIEGLRKMSRHHVHLSPDIATAQLVGGRRGSPVLLKVSAARMHSQGRIFYLSTNGVWLTEHVPPEFIEFP